MAPCVTNGQTDRPHRMLAAMAANQPSADGKWVVWGQEGLDSWDSLMKGIGFGLPGVESQTTGPQTSNIAKIETSTTFFNFCMFVLYTPLNTNMTWGNSHVD